MAATAAIVAAAIPPNFMVATAAAVAANVLDVLYAPNFDPAILSPALVLLASRDGNSRGFGS